MDTSSIVILAVAFAFIAASIIIYIKFRIRLNANKIDENNMNIDYTTSIDLNVEKEELVKQEDSSTSDINESSNDSIIQNVYNELEEVKNYETTSSETFNFEDEIKKYQIDDDDEITKELDVIKPLESLEQLELINVLINKKNFIFDANGNNLQKGERVKVLINRNVFLGIVTKSNYKRNRNEFKVKPQRLIIVGQNKPKEDVALADLEIVPRKKKVE